MGGRAHRKDEAGQYLSLIHIWLNEGEQVVYLIPAVKRRNHSISSAPYIVDKVGEQAHDTTK